VTYTPGDGQALGSVGRPEAVVIMLLSLLGFGLGSLPFSAWAARLLARADVRGVGDGNPGAANAWRAGGWKVGLLALVLDVGKGAFPVLLARLVVGLEGWALVPVALAPALGHTFSPWVGFRGGKAVATTFGVWTGLTYWEVPTAFGLSLAGIRQVQGNDAWTVALALPIVFLFLLLSRSEPGLLVAWGANALLLLWTHRRELRAPPRWRRGP
jgi:glycerol-3-phosphate acyltransferase PlsY